MSTENENTQPEHQHGGDCGHIAVGVRFLQVPPGEHREVPVHMCPDVGNVIIAPSQPEGPETVAVTIASGLIASDTAEFLRLVADALDHGSTEDVTNLLERSVAAEDGFTTE